MACKLLLPDYAKIAFYDSSGLALHSVESHTPCTSLIMHNKIERKKKEKPVVYILNLLQADG